MELGTLHSNQVLCGFPSSTLQAPLLNGSGASVSGPSKRIRINEEAILRYGHRVIGLYAFLAARCHNGVVYMHGRHSDKLGWSRSKFYQVMGTLVHHGLAEKQSWGHYHLARREEVIGTYKGRRIKHKCIVEVEKWMSEKDVIDHVVLKLVERKHRQVTYAILPKEENAKAMAKAQRIKMLEDIERKRHGRPAPDIGGSLLGEDRIKVEERAKSGYVPMNIESLMAATGLGRQSVIAWKKRAKTNKWLGQVDRSQEVPVAIAMTFPDTVREVEEGFRGRVSFSPSRNTFLFHQASCYSLLKSYSPIVNP